jgi:lipopolysaccharide cholinephosphotransferase
MNEQKLRKVQMIQLELLLDLDRFCKENDIHYNLIFGTLLGAVRHKGFIPWDDDLDVGMTRENFEKFTNLYKSDSYFLQNYKTDSHYYRQFSRLRKNGTLFVQNLYKDLAVHHGIFIDIFPFDGIHPNCILEVLRYKVINFMEKINKIRNHDISADKNLFKKIVMRLIQSTSVIIKKPTFDKWQTALIAFKPSNKSTYITNLTLNPYKERVKWNLIKKTDFLNSFNLEFEGHLFPVPKIYHQYLTQIYGDYMQLPPIDKRKPHHGVFKVDF